MLARNFAALVKLEELAPVGPANGEAGIVDRAAAAVIMRARKPEPKLVLGREELVLVEGERLGLLIGHHMAAVEESAVAT